MGRALLGLVVTISCSTAVTSCASHAAGSAALYAAAAESDPRRHPYVLGAADSVRVTVWKDPELSTEAVVRPDGTITVPLVGEVIAAGRTAEELQKELTAKLAAFVNGAVVNVAVLEVNSYRFTVAGNVEHPGMFNPRYYVTISEALALAGGPNRYASTTDIVIVRTGRDRSVQRIPINYDDILSGRSPEEDIVVMAGDAVRVP